MAVVNIVEYQGPSNTLAWKFPKDDLGTWTQLVVRESQEAILFKDGRALDLFGAGRHTLSTNNIPLLTNFINLPFGGKSPFKAEVWFVNKLHTLDIKWGTRAPIQIQDPKYRVFLTLRAFGQFGVQIEDSRKFLIKLVGTMGQFDTDQLTKNFRGIMLTKIKDHISSYLVHKKISMLEISAYLEDISEFIQEKVAHDFDDYGIKVLNFNVNSINVPEDDPSVIKLKNALDRKAEMDIIGYDYQQERSFDTLGAAARNEGSAGTMMGAGMGLGMGVGMGGAFGNQMGNLTSKINTSAPSVNCPSCNHANSSGTRFCQQCGHNLTQPQKEPQGTERICVDCGKSFPANSKFCPHCGSNLVLCSACGADNPDDATVCIKCGQPMPHPCKSCGHQIAGNVKFCPNCGESMSNKCPSCDNEVAPGTKFCPNCGNKF